MPALGGHQTAEARAAISASKKGVPLSAEHRAALSRAKVGKSFPWLHTPDVYRKIAKALTGKAQVNHRDEKHHAWKGGEACYFAFHAWVRRRFGKASRCENPSCVYPRRNASGKVIRKPKRFEWALIHGETHGHRRESYWQLCPSCHRKYDMGAEI